MTTLCVNLRNVAVSQYGNFDFNSFAMIGGKLYGASDDGLFLLEGDDDDGVAIPALLELVKTDFGSSHQKRLRKGFVGYETAGELSLTTLNDDGNSRTVTLPTTRTAMEQQGSRLPVTREGKGRYWTLRIENVLGCDFSLDHIEVTEYTLNRKPSGVA